MSLTTTTLALLNDYAPKDQRETLHYARMRDLVALGSAAFFREHYAPGHFTASAFVVSPDAAHVLLILHSKLHLWLQPGGHVDDRDESLEAAAQRELVEETGLRNVRLVQNSPIDLDVHIIPARGDTPAHEHFDVRFLYRATSDDVRASSDALAAKWIPQGDLTSTATDESVRRAVQKIAACSTSDWSL